MKITDEYLKELEKIPDEIETTMINIMKETIQLEETNMKLELLKAGHRLRITREKDENGKTLYPNEQSRLDALHLALTGSDKVSELMDFIREARNKIEGLKISLQRLENTRKVKTEILRFIASQKKEE